MAFIQVGQEVEVDLFGLQVAGTVLTQTAPATVVGFGPGTVIVRLALHGRGRTELTVNSARIHR
jgi:hypothetical protein